MWVTIAGLLRCDLVGQATSFAGSEGGCAGALVGILYCLKKRTSSGSYFNHTGYWYDVGEEFFYRAL